jgi:hypothetical protein
MLLETEKQQSNRRLEQAKKALNDAMWRKKKEAIMQNVEDGLTLPPSSISDNSIVRSVASKAAEGTSLSQTSYPILARRGVTDYVERSKGVLTIPDFVETHRNHDKKAFDKYMDAHYERWKTSGTSSRQLQAQKGTLSFVSVDYSHAAARGEADLWPRRSADDASFDGSMSLATRNGGSLTGGDSVSDTTFATKSGNYTLNGSAGSGSSRRKNIRLQPLSKSGSASSRGGSIKSAGSSTWETGTGVSSTYDTPKLDPTFYANTARASYARSHAIGKLRKLQKPTAQDEFGDEEQRRKQAEEKAKAAVVPRSKKDQVVNTQRRKPSVLTIRHPGMDVFGDSMTMASINS